MTDPSPLSTPELPIVYLKGVTKRFDGANALNDVNLAIEAGTVHGLVGANGAGKSTCGKIVGGIHSPDAGDLFVDGVVQRRWSPRQALNHGIAMMQQELALVPTLTVLENVFLGIEDRRIGVLSGNERSRFSELQARCRFELNPDRTVGTLRFADRQKVEIMRALARGARLIIMDEPTSALTPDEATKLNDIVRNLKRDGCAVVYVSHFLPMVLDVADRITVLRSGSVVQTTAVAGQTPESLAEAMMGVPLTLTFPPRPPRPADSVPVALNVRNVSIDGLLREVSLTVRKGEIVGLAGLVGSGRSELLRAIFGADPIVEGDVEVLGRPLTNRRPKGSVRSGLAMLPEDRRKQGLVMALSVRHNVTLPHLRWLARWGLLAGQQERKGVAQMLSDLAVVPPRVDGQVSALSGGNQQKVLFAKWLFRRPDVMLLDEPTRGVDVGSKFAIYRFIAEIASSGVAVLLVSSELEEVIELSHRVYVLHHGRLVAELDPMADDQTAMRTAFMFGLVGADGANPLWGRGPSS